jgi:nitrogen fixation protein NifB
MRGRYGHDAHCRQCRADAVGLLGEDRGAEFAPDKLDAMSIDYALAMSRRQETRTAIFRQLEERDALRVWKTETNAMTTIIPEQKPERDSPLAAASHRPVLMAVASAGQGLINQHFGHAREFLVYEASPTGVCFIGLRKADLYCAGTENCGEEEVKKGEGRSAASILERTIAALSGCEVLLCARIGFEPWSRLEAAGIQPNGEHAMEVIEDAVLAVYREMAAAGKLAAALQKVA